MAPLKRALGLPSLTFYGVGIIIGAGIYSVIGAAGARAGDALWLSFALSSVVALLTALTYAELATMYPEASAEYTYLRHAFPRWPHFALITGLLVALSGTATAATVSIAFAGYLGTFIDFSPFLIAWALLAAATVLNILGIKETARVNAAFTLLEVGGLVLFVIVGATSNEFGKALSAKPDAGVLAGAALVFFSYLGFENIANLSEETREPGRDLPRAILLSLGIASILYVLVALAAVALMPPEQLAETSAPLADAARTKAPWVAGALGGIALFATANTALVSLLVAARIVFGMARDGSLPKRLAAIHERRQTPHVATLIVAALAAALIPFGKIAVVASLSSFGALLAFAAVNLALITLRYREPRAARPFRVPMSFGKFPMLPALGLAATLVTATQIDRAALLAGSLALGAFLLYSIWRVR